MAKTLINIEEIQQIVKDRNLEHIAIIQKNLYNTYYETEVFI